MKPQDIGIFEIHDCFSITGLLMLEAIGIIDTGKAPEYVLQESSIPINATGGLIGFGHPTGASGVDLQQNLSKKSKSPFGLMISRGGDDKTVTAIVVKLS